MSQRRKLRQSDMDNNSSSGTIDAMQPSPRHNKISRDCSTSCSTVSTVDAIREICNDCDRDFIRISQPPCDTRLRESCIPPCDDRRPCHPGTRFDPGVSYFTSVVTPVNGLTPLYSGCTGSVEFRMRRKNKTVILQWEPFTGSIAQNGIAFLTVAQSISNTPPYPISLPIYIIYNGVGRITHININPNAKCGNILFYLNTDGSHTGISVNDTFTIPGAAISWIVDC
jgi:hypothetical protein